MFVKRKHTRLKEYDYSQNGVYFVTICARDRQPYFGRIVGRGALTPPEVALSEYGRAVARYIANIPVVYDGVAVDQMIIMPDHLHLLIAIDHKASGENGGLGAARPTLSGIVRGIKSMTTRACGRMLWQDGFYEHIVRNQRDYEDIWRYIEENPARWAQMRPRENKEPKR